MTHQARQLTLAFAAALALFAASCGGQSRERLLVDWTFAGQPCSTAGVATIRVFIAGQALTPDTWQCAQGTGITTGADLGVYLTGTYSLEVDGYDGAGILLYQAVQTVQVRPTGDNRIAIDLAAVPQTSVTLIWTFAGKTCAAAGNPTVQVFLDNSSTPLTDVTGNANLPCTQQATNGTFQDGISIYPLDPGQHVFTLNATGPGGAAYTLRAFPVTATYGQNVTANPDLQPATPACPAGAGACANVLFSFNGLSCADAQVDAVNILVDNVVIGTPACSDSGTLVTNLAAGQHNIAIDGLRGSGGTIEYQSGNLASQFTTGSTTDVTLDATGTGYVIGNATLGFQFPAGGPSCSSPGLTSISYTLTDPTGVQRGAAQAACGGGSNGLVFCDTRISSCPQGSLSGLSPGLWTISASTQNTTGHVYIANYSFAVANDALSQYTLLFQ